MLLRGFRVNVDLGGLGVNWVAVDLVISSLLRVQSFVRYDGLFLRFW